MAAEKQTDKIISWVVGLPAAPPGGHQTCASAGVFAAIAVLAVVLRLTACPTKSSANSKNRERRRWRIKDIR